MSTSISLKGVNTVHDKNHKNVLAQALADKKVGNAYFIFNGTQTVYSDAALTKAAYKIKSNTCAKISSITTGSSSKSSVGIGRFVLGLDAGGGKIVYIGYAYYKVSVGTKPYYYFSSTNYNKIGWQTAPANITKDNYLSGISASSYYNLNSGGVMDDSRVEESNTSTEELEESQEGIADNAIANTAAAASSAGVASSSAGVASSADGDIEVTYDYAVVPAPSFFYNIGEHLARYRQVTFDEEGNVAVDEDGNIIYATDADGNYVMTGPADALDSYKASTAVNGINYKNLRNLFGAPYQFLPTTDCRITGGNGTSGSGGFSENLELAGYEFTEKILSRMPLLFITPGNTSFMGGSSENARTALISQLDESYVDKALSENSLKSMLEDYNGKLYTIMPAYAEYFNYVNPMCRAGAIFLGIQEKTLQGKTLDVFNWGINQGQDYKVYMEEEQTMLGDEEAEEIEEEVETTEQTTEETEPEEEEEKYNWEDHDDIFEKPEDSFLKDFQQAMYYKNAIPFYINSEASFQDSFSNETTESSLASTINALSDRAREIQFLLGTASSAVGEAFDKVDGTLTEIKEQINNIVSKVAGGNSIFTTIANSVKTIVSGGRLLFPQIWSNSQFTKSYNISIKLTTPSYDKFSWWLNIYVPLCHLMALVLPRSEYVNSYTTPFLIKAFYRGMFNIDMGIITEMSFNRGKEGSWTKDGLPTVVDVSFSIQDLYTGMGMTSLGAMFKGTTLQNVSEMDYIANLCGININEPDLFRMVTLWATFNLKNRISDFLPNMSMNIGTSLRNMGMNMYNSLWGL